jgi:hypothetical protein
MARTGDVTLSKTAFELIVQPLGMQPGSNLAPIERR